MEGAKEGHATTTIIEIENGELQFAPSTGDNLQRTTDASCNERDSAGANERFTQQSIEIVIARVEKNKLSFHRIPVLAFNSPPAAAIQATAVCRC